jgi:predicted negative regulator of RcsB-dependent stress response
LKRIITTPLLIAVLLILSGCVTQKKKGEDVGAIKKFYQDTTSEFNYYFNAGVIMDETFAAMNEQYTDNYNKVLPIWQYTEIDNPQAHYEQMDKAIEKVSIMIELHRASHWADDGYLMMAQAQYLKKDYESAEATLLYMTDEFSPNSMRKKDVASNKRKKNGKRGVMVDKNGKKKLTKKQRVKEAKKKKKVREKERKAKKKEIAKRKKARKKGKKLPPKTTTKKEDDKKKEDPKLPKIDEDDIAAPKTIRLGNLTPEVQNGKPDAYFLKHRPAYQEGILWLARTYIERDNYTMAERMMNQLSENPTTFEDIKEQLSEVKAHFYLNQKKYEQALPMLSQILEKSNDRQLKARVSFIIGQINQRLKNSAAAAVAYEQAIKFHPAYEMEFNARLKLATTSWKTGRGTSTEAKRNLKRMLKDLKNEEFKDAIYFALADISLSEGNRTEAIANLRQSAWNSIKNVNQKTEAYLMLGDLFYEDEDYVFAKTYYDSTFQLMAKTDDRWSTINNLNNNLTDIAANIIIVETQDSLLRISELPDDEKAKVAARIKQKRDEEARAKIAWETKQNELRKKIATKGSAGASTSGISLNRSGGQTARGNGSSRGIVTTGGGSSFFAYGDPSDLKKSKRDFERQWGARDLSDNWRRSSAATFGNDKEAAEEIVAENLSEDDVAKILAGLPNSPEEKAAANKQIEDALFALGGLFRDRLQNYGKATERLEDLTKRYPETEYQLDAYYMLYLSYKQLNNSAKMKLYGDKIINEYPNSTYAQLIKDPSYIKQILSNERQLQVYYEETYDAFTQKKYQIANERILKVAEQFGATNPLQPRFALLSAMISGNLKGRESYIAGLKDVMAKYPETPEQIRARDMLRLLGAKQASGPGQERANAKGEEGDVSLYTFEENKLHYMLVILDKDASMNDAKIGVSDYNRKYHNLDKLRISNIFLGGADEKIPMIVIRRYKKMKDAMTYFEGIQKNSGDFLPGMKYTVYPVTQNNYRTILKEKTLAGYDEFFNLYYTD